MDFCLLMNWKQRKENNMEDIIEYLQEELDDIEEMQKEGGKGDGVIFISPDDANQILSALEENKRLREENQRLSNELDCIYEDAAGASL
jgi:DNA helicase IV